MEALLNWLWQGGVVAATSFVMLLALERARANVRYLVCWAASIVVLALPAVPWLQSAAIPASTAIPAAPGDAMVLLPDAWWTSSIVILAAWMVWAGVHALRFVSAIVAIRRARSRSRAFPSHVEAALPHWRRIRSEGRRATLVLSEAVTTAAVLGWGAPMIAVAPSLVTTLDDDELDRILVHEWAHVQRRDDVVNVLQIVVRLIAGWHPAIWWIDRRLHIEREMACDEIAVARTGSARSYAECLMKLASLRGTLGAMRMAPAVLASSGLRARVIRIVSPRPSIAPARSRAVAAAIVTLLCVMSVGLGGLALVQAAPLALPFVSARMPPVTFPALSPATATARPARRIAAREPSTQRPLPAPPSPAPLPQPESEPRPAADTRPVGSTSAPEVDAPPLQVIAARVPSAPPSVPHLQWQSVATTSDEAAEPSPSPWTTAAAGGAAIGRKSKDAGVATAGFFTRMARRVAGARLPERRP